MKKHIAAGGAIVLALTLTGCGNGKSNDCPTPKSMAEPAGFPVVRPAPRPAPPAPRPAPRPAVPAPKPAPKQQPQRQQPPRQQQQNNNHSTGFWPWLWFSNNDRNERCK